jgi:hypothetical protein
MVERDIADDEAFTDPKSKKAARAKTPAAKKPAAKKPAKTPAAKTPAKKRVSKPKTNTKNVPAKKTASSAQDTQDAEPEVGEAAGNDPDANKENDEKLDL